MPLWELLPRDVQELIARLVKQKMLWRLFAMNDPRRRPGLRAGADFAHAARVENLMRVTPVFRRELRTVYLLSVPVRRWHHHVSFADGLVRLAWEMNDRPQQDAHGASHVSVPWKFREGHLCIDGLVWQSLAVHALQAITMRAYQDPGSRYLPNHYVASICATIAKGVQKGTLHWVHGGLKRRILQFVCQVVNANWYGRTTARQRMVTGRIEAAMDEALACAPQGGRVRARTGEARA